MKSPEEVAWNMSVTITCCLLGALILLVCVCSGCSSCGQCRSCPIESQYIPSGKEPVVPSECQPFRSTQDLKDEQEKAMKDLNESNKRPMTP